MSTRTFLTDSAGNPATEDGSVNYKIIDKATGEVEFDPSKRIVITNFFMALINAPKHQLADAEFTEVKEEPFIAVPNNPIEGA